MDFGQAFLRWRAIYQEGWGQAWWLASEIDQRYGDALGLTLYPITHEGLGFYGIKIDQVSSTKRKEPIGRISIGGNVENWRDPQSGLNALSLDERPASEQALDGTLKAAIRHLQFEHIRPPPRTFRTPVFTLYFRLLAMMALRVRHTEFGIYPLDESRKTCNPANWNWRLSSQGGHVDLFPSGEMVFRGEKMFLVHEYQAGQRLSSLAEMLLSRLEIPESPHKNPEYSIQEHSHRYSAWCASRAASRGLAGFSTEKARAALEHCGLAQLISGPVQAWPTNPKDFDRLHAAWCREIQDFLRQHDVPKASFGHAAKIVAIYLKGRVVCGGALDSALAHIAHPPIDRLLLQALAKDKRFPLAERKKWKTINWTQFTAQTYLELIESLRKAHLHETGFWKVEKYWSGS